MIKNQMSMWKSEGLKKPPKYGWLLQALIWKKSGRSTAFLPRQSKRTKNSAHYTNNLYCLWYTSSLMT